MNKQRHGAVIRPAGENAKKIDSEYFWVLKH